MDFLSPDVIKLTEDVPHLNLFDNNYSSRSLAEAIISRYFEAKLLSITLSDGMGRMITHQTNTLNGVDIAKIPDRSLMSGLYVYSVDFEANVCDQKVFLRKSGKFVVVNE